MRQKPYPVFLRAGLPALLLIILCFQFGAGKENVVYAAAPAPAINTAFTQAAQQYGVPVELLKAIAYMESRLSMHNGTPSIDGGYGLMHLVKNRRADTLDQAAKDLGVSAQRLQSDAATNILGGAAVLRDTALQLSSSHTLPNALAGWYGAIAAYSHATTRSTALMYADSLYKLLNSGFSTQAEDGETVTLAAQKVQPDHSTATAVKGASTLPAGCKIDTNVDYPAAIDCIVDPNTFDCNLVSSTAPCTYDGANRPNDLSILQVVIHDIEGTAQNALNVFQDPNSFVSVHYIVDSDGTVYQVIHEKDIAFHAGNFWYNQHSVGIEHAGFDATGFQWYNATEYLSSAKLTAYLLKKYHIPLDHAHVVSHGTIPSPTLGTSPNHVDPGPYWLWDYYLNLVHQQGVPFSKGTLQSHIITLKPSTDLHPFGKNGTETPANFNFFYLYNGPSTASGLIPQQGDGTDITDVTNNVEPAMSYFFLAKVKDPAGTGDTLYEIWYGEEDQAHANPISFFATAHLAWLAVPPGTAIEGQGTVVALTGTSGANAEIFGKPITGEQFHIGDAPNNATFVSAYTVIEDGGTTLWYEINYNHRQAWVPASEVTIVHAAPTQ